MRLDQFAPTDVKTLMLSTDVQEKEISSLISPKPAISETNLKNVKPILGKRNKKAVNTLVT